MASMEVVRQVYTGSTDECIEVGPDRDGLGLVEIRSKGDDGKVIQSTTMTLDAANLLSAALANCANEMEEENG